MCCEAMGAGWLAKTHVEQDTIQIGSEPVCISTGAFQSLNALESFKLVEAGAFKDEFQFASTINLNLSAVPLIIACMTFILRHFLLNISTEKLWLLLGTIFGISWALKNKAIKFTIDNWFGQTGKNGAALKCEKSQEHHIPYLGDDTWKFMVVKKDD